jgi:Putative beta-barrel porin-2, OmpL-like. bbp2
MPGRIVIAILLPCALTAQDRIEAPSAADLAKQIAGLNAVIEKLERRVDELESRLSSAAAAEPPTTKPTVQNEEAAEQPHEPAPAKQAAVPAPNVVSNFLRGTSVNFMVDGYYGYNFNSPIGRVNRLRAYDVLSNAFSLNQADAVFENAPDLKNGKRWGLRLDLQFGQATETLQANAANEPRPEIYRNIFQAYGTYIVPVGSGLTLDFGKFASSLGMEGNFTQDDMNYSRSYWFNFLPFYHMGIRANYQISKSVALNYWVVNGTQQTEPFNNFKDQFFGFTIQPAKSVTWNVNYYLGQEHPDVVFFPNSTNPNLPTLQGEPFLPIPNAPKGKLHIFDSYVTWKTTPKLTLAMEADYVIERLYTNSAPSETWGGAGYLRYQFFPRWAIAGRAEYLEDGGGFSAA